MREKIKRLRELIRLAFAFERVLCRLAASWLCMAALLLLTSDGAFYSLDFIQNTAILPLLLGGILVFLLLSLLNLALPDLETDSWPLLVGATLCTLRWTVDYAAAGFLYQLALLVFYCLIFFYCFVKNEELIRHIRIQGRSALMLALLGGGACAAVIGAVTCLRYLSFFTPNFDFGLFVNMFHNMRETGLPIITSERDVSMTHFAVHLSPIYYLILPFYALFPSPLTLQIAQAVILASGVIPILFLSRRLGLSLKMGALAALLYALYPALSTGSFYDLHENCFLAPLLLWVFYFFEAEAWLPMYGFSILTLLVKEDAAVYLILFAAYVLLGRKKWLHGLILALGSIAYFLGALAILEAASAHYAELYAQASPNPPIDGPMINRFDNLIYDQEAGLAGALKTAILNPGYLLTQLFLAHDGGFGKLIYLVKMLLPLGFLPFFSKKPSRWLLSAPILLNILTTYQYQYDTGFQYHFGITAFLFYAALSNLAELKLPCRTRVAALAVAASCCAYLASVTPPLNYYAEYYAVNSETCREAEALLDRIPKDASVTASTFFLAHLADRAEIYERAFHGYGETTDYVVLDLRYESEVSAAATYRQLGYTVLYEIENFMAILAYTAQQ